jgi:hypothetical protein
MGAVLPDPSQPSDAFLIVAFVLWKTEHWSNGALGTVLLGLMSIAAIVGTLMAPFERER